MKIQGYSELCPAKLEGRDKGNLISIITSDIELLEVFYAHTISPVAIALIVSACMTVFIWHGSAAAGIIALCAYITVGAVIPLVNAKLGGAEGLKFRNAFENLSAFVLDSLRGLDETIQRLTKDRSFIVCERALADAIGNIQAFIQYVRSFNQPISQVANLVNMLQSTAAAALRA